jgi:hypothetical protein
VTGAVPKFESEFWNNNDDVDDNNKQNYKIKQTLTVTLPNYL